MSGIRSVALGESDSDYDSSTDSDSDLELDHIVSSSERETTPDEDGGSSSSSASSGGETEVVGLKEEELEELDEVTETVIGSVAAIQLGLKLGGELDSEQHKQDLGPSTPASPATFHTCAEPTTPTTPVTPVESVEKDEERESDQKEHKEKMDEESASKSEDQKHTETSAEEGDKKVEEEESVLLLRVTPPVSPISSINPIPRPVSSSPPWPLIKPLPLAICAPPPSDMASSSTKSVSVSASASSSSSKAKHNGKARAETQIEFSTETELQTTESTEAKLLAYLKDIDGNTTEDGPEDAREELLRNLPLPISLPFPLPRNTEVKEEILPATAFERRFVNKDMGYGLVALQPIPAGTVILADPVLAIWADEQGGCLRRDAANVMIQRKARKMGKEWYKKFLMLSKPMEKQYGAMAAIWDQHNLSIGWCGKRGGIIGLNLAWINHACIPNANITYESTYPSDKDGNPRFDQQPQLGRAVIRACTEIRPGVEICISYTPTRGTAAMRQSHTESRFEFKCACRVCTNPTDLFENALYAHHRLEDMINDRKIISDRPVLAFKVALDLIEQLLRASVHDNRIVLIWMKCAMIAGHHSDLARAHCFLTRARQLAFLLEGPSGGTHRQVRNWYMAPRLMPGFGATVRGLSSVTEALTIYRAGRSSKRILFMIGADPAEYIRVSRYKEVPITENEKEENNTEGSDNAEIQQTCWEIIDGLDPIPPKLDMDTEPPIHELCSVKDCAACKRTERRENKIRESRERRRAGVKKEGKEKKEDDEEEKKVCTDPELDFNKVFLDVVDSFEHPDGDGDGADTAEAKKKRIRDMLRRETKWYFESKFSRILAPDADADTAGSSGCHAHNSETAESVEDAGEGRAEQTSKNKKKKRKSKKKNKAAEPGMQDVGAEKRVVLVELDGGVGTTAAKAE
ncbi:hypothetical protein BJY01DRAFT_253181 [Aspergillus pseudoustus]|uniref:SET domain-containing protein n=1 Tax=Aspergillus pseudoustus TaxID=1810923 RepID=A0ABR4J4Y7_9EURO